MATVANGYFPWNGSAIKRAHCKEAPPPVHSDDVEHNQEDITMTRILYKYMKDLKQN